MSRPRKVSVAVLSWNGKAHLEVCLPSLESQLPPGVEHEVLVLDNGSTDGTAEWVRRHHPQVRLIESRINLGFCGGNNRLAAAADGDAIAFLNNDTRPRPEWLGSLVDALASAQPDVAAVSGQIVNWSGEKLDFARGILTFDGHAFQQDFGRPLDEIEIPAAGSELLFACGGNMIVRRDAFLAAGGFDEAYFAYLEDVDLGWRLWAGGERVVFAPDAVVHHRSMATSQLLGNDNRGFLFERNAFLTAYKNYDAEMWARLAPAILLTFNHRTQTLLVQNNPGGDQLTIDPYAGLIANTGAPEPAGDEPGTDPGPVLESVAPPPPPETSWGEKWRGYGPSEFFRRGARKAARLVTPGWLWQHGEGVPELRDGRTLAQLRAQAHLLGHLDASAERRRATQARRRRSDREIFERFGFYAIPTYPGDEKLFASPAFASWIGDDLPLVHATLDEIMATRGSG